MDKTVKSIAEQISLLKSRKVIIDNERLAARILKYENYYYLINGYKTPFINSTNGGDLYKPGTRFEEILALYTFDRRLRELLLPELLRIEHSIKACIVDVFSNRHSEKHTNYLRPESFNSEAFSNFKRTNALIFDLLRLIEKIFA